MHGSEPYQQNMLPHAVACYLNDLASVGVTARLIWCYMESKSSNIKNIQPKITSQTFIPHADENMNKYNILLIEIKKKHV